MDGDNQANAVVMPDQMAITPDDRSRAVVRARWLAWFTIIYNLAEGIVAVSFGVGDESVALLGFGIDSFIEMASASFVLWRLRAEFGGVAMAVSRERHASLAVSLLLILLGVGAMLGSLW